MAARKPSGPEQGALPSVVYLAGEERLLIEDALERLRKQALAQIQAPDFNHDRVSARGTNAQGIVNLCRTLPVMSPRRLVEVRDAEAIPAADHPLLIEYVQRPDPSCTLILVGDKADMRTTFMKALNDARVLRIHGKMPERELAGWVETRARKHAITLTDDAVENLVSSIGSELMLMERSLEKLRLVVGEGGQVTDALVAEHIATTRVETSFRIVDAMAAGRLGEAVEVMLSVVEAGEPPLRLLGALTYAQRQSIRLLGLLEQGVSPFDAGRQLRIFRNVDQMASRVKAAGRARLSEGLCAIADADRALKSSASDDENVLMELLFKLARLQGRPGSGARDARGSTAGTSSR